MLEQSVLAELRDLGLNLDITETTARSVKGALLIIEGRIRQGDYRTVKPFENMPHAPKIALQSSVTVFRDAYHAVAKLVVGAETPRVVIVETIPRFLSAFALWREWPTANAIGWVQKFSHGPSIEWEGRLLQMGRTSSVAQEAGKPSLAPMNQEQLIRTYFAQFPEKIKIVDVCWAARQRYREWTRWRSGKLKDTSTASRAFNAILNSGKRPEEYRKDPRPAKWK